jgi:cytoskeletal protein RodZ
MEHPEETNINNTEERIPESSAAQDQPSKEKPWGSIVGIIIVVALIILGGWYVWESQLSGQPANENPESSATAEDPVVQTLEEQGTSDELGSIEQDLEASSFNELDADLESIEQELN